MVRASWHAQEKATNWKKTSKLQKCGQLLSPASQKAKKKLLKTAKNSKTRPAISCMFRTWGHPVGQPPPLCRTLSRGAGAQRARQGRESTGGGGGRDCRQSFQSVITAAVGAGPCSTYLASSFYFELPLERCRRYTVACCDTVGYLEPD